jgi:hypothetical protein
LQVGNDRLVESERNGQVHDFFHAGKWVSGLAAATTGWVVTVRLSSLILAVDGARVSLGGFVGVLETTVAILVFKVIDESQHAHEIAVVQILVSMSVEIVVGGIHAQSAARSSEDVSLYRN